MEQSTISKSLPDLPKKNNLALLSREEKIDKLLSVFESIDEVNGFTIVKFKNKVIIGSESDLGIVSGKNIILKTLEGSVYLN
jgi:hypothetical protein